jgi:hypothetical protein
MNFRNKNFVPLLWLSPAFLEGIWLGIMSVVPEPLHLPNFTLLSFPAFPEKRFAD